MSTKYCSSCSATRNIEGGQNVNYRSSDGFIRHRWKCRHCIARTSESIYSKKAKVIRPIDSVAK